MELKQLFHGAHWGSWGSWGPPGPAGRRPAGGGGQRRWKLQSGGRKAAVRRAPGARNNHIGQWSTYWEICFGISGMLGLAQIYTFNRTSISCSLGALSLSLCTHIYILYRENMKSGGLICLALEAMRFETRLDNDLASIFNARRVVHLHVCVSVVLRVVKINRRTLFK